MTRKFVRWETEEPIFKVAECCTNCRFQARFSVRDNSVSCNLHKALFQALSYTRNESYLNVGNYQVSKRLVCDRYEQNPDINPRKLCGWRDNEKW